MAARFPRIWVRVLSLSLTVSSPLGLGVILWGLGALAGSPWGFVWSGSCSSLRSDSRGLVVPASWARIAAILACRSGLSAGRGWGRRPRGGATVAEQRVCHWPQ